MHMNRNNLNFVDIKPINEVCKKFDFDTHKNYIIETKSYSMKTHTERHLTKYKIVTNAFF